MINLILNKRTLFLVGICFAIISCHEVNPEDDNLIYNEQAIREFSATVSSNSGPISKYVSSYLQGKFTANMEEDQLTEEEARKLINAMIKPSKDFLVASGFTENELLSEFDSLEGPEMLLTAITVLTKLDSDDKSSKSVKNLGYDNSIMKCLGSASGIKGLWDLATGTAAASRATILKVVGKVARRSLGWVGATLFLGEFVQCYWGNNSSFE